MINYLRRVYVEIRYHLYKIIYPYPHIYSIFETLDFVLISKKSIARFGDGEFHMLGNSEDLGFQKMDEKLATRLKDVLNNSNDDCIVALPGGIYSIRGLNKVASYFWKQFYVFHYPRYANLLNVNQKYYNASFTRPYIDFANKQHSASYFQKLKGVWNNQKVLIVEGENSRLGVGNDLFDNVKELRRIVTLSTNAFQLYDKLFEATKSIVMEYDLVLIALGPTATVLAYDLSKLGVWAIDIGHIDVEYEWFLRGVDEKVAIEGKHVNEFSYHIKDTDCLDINYQSQIINRLLN
ncbi:SP_1767 family glycosyltransferase [Sphingobacterium bovistauri]|uniref:SP_1767 family glycosyltransferase n=1 Tax=Sphingobacterium bovistauri TaxID=2781959 RepID=A0ABS7Z3X0_9SPHI|nr:SP_1767 family glycosyltransferase [Sphingobacterium bovistauri]MCA5004121.1 SP_1767 family glycosyltransferase [Sphingobacterium bovistauri]